MSITSYDTVVIGGGKFGCVIARALRDVGKQKVVVIDNRHPMGGSRPSGGLMKPSWITMMNKQDMSDGFALLDRLYGIDDIQLNMFGTRILPVTAHHVEVHKVLDDPILDFVEETVTNVFPGLVKTSQGEYTCKYIVVAAGVWINEIANVKVPGLYGKRGVSFVYPGDIEAFIKPWAPYKQIVAHKHRAGYFWAGDGTALKTENWTQEREEVTADRVARAVKRNKSEARRQHGVRPFVDGYTNKKPCYFERHGNIWTTTGGGKNGMIASAWAANQILKAVA